MRVLSERQGSELKGVTEASFVKGGGVTSFAEMTRVNVSTFSKYASQSDDNKNNFVGIDITVEADMRAKQPIIVAEMARMLGYRLVRDDVADQPCRLSERDALILAVKTGQLEKVILDALADDRIDRAENAQIVDHGLAIVKQVDHIFLAARASK